MPSVVKRASSKFGPIDLAGVPQHRSLAEDGGVPLTGAAHAAPATSEGFGAPERGDQIPRPPERAAACSGMGELAASPPTKNTVGEAPDIEALHGHAVVIGEHLREFLGQGVRAGLGHKQRDDRSYEIVVFVLPELAPRRIGGSSESRV